jgi:hypothetical protein
MATPNQTEYISIDGLPLSTAAWSTEDIATILDGPATRGSDLTIPARAGAVARRRVLEPRQITIPVVVNGWYDSDGVEHADPREGLLANLDELKRHLAPQYTTTAGTRTLLWDNGAGIYRSAEVHVSPSLQVAAIGPNAARVVISATIPGGVLREAGGLGYAWHGISDADNEETFTVTVSGTGEVQDALIYFAGRATWPGPSMLTTGTGAPAPGSGTTGDWYYDLDDAAADTPLYGPRGSGGDWPGPFEVQFGFGAPQDINISRAEYWVTIVGGTVDEVYGPRTVAEPDAASFKLENLSYDPTGGTYIEITSAVAHALSIDCGAYYAERNASDVSGEIVTGGTPLWLPLLPGENTLRLVLTSNSEDSAVNVLYRAVYL